MVNAADARVPGSRIAVEFHHVFNVPFPVYDALLTRTQEPDSPLKDAYAAHPRALHPLLALRARWAPLRARHGERHGKAGEK